MSHRSKSYKPYINSTEKRINSKNSYIWLSLLVTILLAYRDMSDIFNINPNAGLSLLQLFNSVQWSSPKSPVYVLFNHCKWRQHNLPLPWAITHLSPDSFLNIWGPFLWGEKKLTPLAWIFQNWSTRERIPLSSDQYSCQRPVNISSPIKEIHLFLFYHLLKFSWPT